jgi:hypothetical protein
MPRAGNRFIESTAVTALVAAFGTVFLLPALETWDQYTLLWWLFYLVATALASNSGRQPVTGFPRFLIALLPALAPLLHLVFQIFVLERTANLSGLVSDNPRFWIAVAVLCLMTWILVWLFSQARDFIAAIVRWLLRDKTEEKINTIARGLTAITSLLGVVGLLISNLMQTR